MVMVDFHWEYELLIKIFLALDASEQASALQQTAE